MQQPSPRAFAARSNPDSTCDVNERDSPFPRLQEGKGAWEKSENP